jgi:hypothetical protein
MTISNRKVDIVEMGLAEKGLLVVHAASYVPAGTQVCYSALSYLKVCCNVDHVTLGLPGYGLPVVRSAS